MSRPPKGTTRSIEIVCANCGGAKRKPLAFIAKARIHFCSAKCHAEWQRGKPAMSPEVYAAQSLRWRGAANPNWKGGPERNKRLYQAWVNRNRESVRNRNANRRAMKRNAPGGFTLAEWEALKASHGHACVRCHRREPEIKLTRDHIVPLSRGGTNYISNIQPLCLACNSSKKDRTEVAA